MSHNYPYSPNRGFRLQTIDGTPDTIQSRGEHYNAVAAMIEKVVSELGKLAKRQKYRSEALDVIRESSGELSTDLEKVQRRYEKSGPVLVTYAKALRRAQNTTVDPLVTDIQQAHHAHTEAAAAQRTAERDLESLEHVWPWEDQPTSSELRIARNEVSDARTDATAKASTLNELWVSFESGYDTWENAYDTAVTDLEKAYEASGVDDEWWEDLLDGLIAVVTVIAAIAVVVALFVAAPIAAVLLAIATIASVIALAATLTLAFAGSNRVSGWDIAFAIIGVVPFLGAFAKGIRGGLRPMASLTRASGARTTSRAALDRGRNSVAYDLRSIRGAGGSHGGRAAREARAGDIADRFATGVFQSRGANLWNAIRSGGSRSDGIAITMSQRMANAWPGGSPGHATANWLRANSQTPGLFMSGANAFNFVSTNVQAGGNLVDAAQPGLFW